MKKIYSVISIIGLTLVFSLNTNAQVTQTSGKTAFRSREAGSLSGNNLKNKAARNSPSSYFDYNRDNDVNLASTKGKPRSVKGNQDVEVENNETHWVGRDRKIVRPINQQQSLSVTTSDIEAYNRQNNSGSRGLIKTGAGTLPAGQNSVVFEGNDEPLWAKGKREKNAAPHNSGRNRQQNLSRAGNRRRP